MLPNHVDNLKVKFTHSHNQSFSTFPYLPIVKAHLVLRIPCIMKTLPHFHNDLGLDYTKTQSIKHIYIFIISSSHIIKSRSFLVHNITKLQGITSNRTLIIHENKPHTFAFN